MSSNATLQNRKTMVMTALVAMATLAGCLSMSVELTVNSDGDIDNMYVSVKIDDQAYRIFESSVRDNGYDDVEEWLTSNVTENLSANGSVQSGHEKNNETQTVWVRVTDVPKEELEGDLQITVDDDDDEIEMEAPNVLGISETQREGLGAKQIR